MDVGHPHSSGDLTIGLLARMAGNARSRRVHGCGRSLAVTQDVDFQRRHETAWPWGSLGHHILASGEHQGLGGEGGVAGRSIARSVPMAVVDGSAEHRETGTRRMEEGSMGKACMAGGADSSVAMSFDC